MTRFATRMYCLLRTLPAAALASVLLAGCSPYKFVGDHVMRFGEEAIVPATLADDDPVTACRAAEAFAAAAISFEGVGTDVNRIAVLLFTATGVCAEGDALAAELAYLRGLQQRDTVMASDARVRQKRMHELAARRQYKGWQRFTAVYGDLREGQCPKKFRNTFDETVFLVGLVAGVQAVLNDTQIGQAVGVPRDIALRAAHLSTCLDNEKWWNVPLSIQAALWAILPPMAPDGVDPMALLEQNARIGAARGVRLGHVVWALSAHGSGDGETAKRAIRDFASSTPGSLSREHRLLDRIAEGVIIGLSDRIWTEATGVRTPMGGLGTFPDDPAPAQSNIDDLLAQ